VTLHFLLQYYSSQQMFQVFYAGLRQNEFSFRLCAKKVRHV